jgi:PAT family beta-lactamase induction signal transducer AmpG
MLYMMQQLAPGPYKTAHYAFATGIMGLSMMFTGMISGPIQEAIGHANFFTVVLVASVPPVLFAAFAPFAIREEKTAEGAIPAGH